MPTIVMLPGMDGSGIQFAEFISSLGDSVKAIAVSYPPDRPLGYSELEVLVRSALPVDDPFILLGESFSGPIAVALAASSPPGLRGLVLVGSFVRSPMPVPRLLRNLLSAAPVWRFPISLVAAFLLGRYATQPLRAQLAAALAQVIPQVWRARIRSVLDVDCTSLLSRIRVPVLYLKASEDRVVSRSASELISRSLPGVRVVELEGPHFMLQAKPAESAAQVLTFARDVGLALSSGSGR